MKLAILGNGNLSYEDLEDRVEGEVIEIFVDDEGLLNPGLKRFCEVHSIELVVSKKGKDRFHNTMTAVFFYDSYMNFYK